MNLAAESHVDRSIDGPGDFIADQHRRHLQLLQAALAIGARYRRSARKRSASCTSRPTRCSARSARGLVHRRHALRAQLALFGQQGGIRPSGARLAPTYGLPALITNCSNNYGPYQFPEKLIPLMIINALRGQAAAGLWRRPERPRLAVRRGPRQRAATSAWKAAAPARRTMSAAATSGPILHVVETIGDQLDRTAPNRPTAQVPGRSLMSDRPGHDRAMQSTPPKSSASSAGSLPRLRNGHR